MTGWFPRLLLITFAFQASIYAIRPMVSYTALDLGASALDVGLIASSYAVLSLLVAVAVGRRVDRWGEVPFIGAGLALVLATAVSLVWIDSLVLLAANQAILGLGHIMTLVGCQTLIANGTADVRRDAAFGYFMVVASLGQLVGPAAAGLLADAGSSASSAVDARGVFAGAATLSALAVLVAISLQVRPGSSGAGRHPRVLGSPLGTLPAVRQVLRVRGMPPAMVASLTVLTTVDVLAAYLPLFAEDRGISVKTVGLLLAVRAGASMASRLLMLPLLRAAGRRWLLVASLAVPAVAMSLLPLARPLPLLFAVIAVIGFGLGLGQPLTLTWVTRRARPEVRGTAIGVRQTGNRLGQLVLPAGVGLVAGAAGVTAIFPSLGLLLLVSAALVVGAPFDDEDPLRIEVVK